MYKRQLIPYSPHGFDIFRVIGRIIHLLSEMTDMYHYGIIAVAKILFSPNLLEEILGADHFPPVLTQDPQNRKFRGRQGKGTLI